MVEWWYKNDVEKVLNFAKKIQRTFEEYRNKVNKVRLDEQNCDKLLYSVCHVYEPERQVGIVTRIHKGSAFLRLLRSTKDSEVTE
jgi:protein involved in sex pheromone biosynthesis